MFIDDINKIYFSFFLKIIILMFNLSIIISFKSKEIYINIDNQFSDYEENIDFSNFSTDIKLIALYSPALYSIENHSELFEKEKNQLSNIENNISIYYKQYKPLTQEEFKDCEHYNFSGIHKFKEQINLAKSHGIYGFAIYYFWFNEKQLFKNPLDLFLNIQNIDFHFLLILKKERWNFNKKAEKENKKLLIKEEEINENLIITLINDIKKYMIDKRYIRINNKAILGISVIKNIPNCQKSILFLRKKAKEYGIGELFIVIYFSKKYNNYFSQLNHIESGYNLSRINILNIHKLMLKNIYLYNKILNKNISNLTTIFNHSMFIRNLTKFDKYSSEKSYMINKILFEWTLKNCSSNQRIIFVNSWNDQNNGIYLEPNQKYGYAMLNSLSKALFNLSYIYSYNLNNLNKSVTIAIQVHVFYENLINDIIQKTNNIPVKFDLYISTDSELKKVYINDYILAKSKAVKFEIQIFNNKGRDVLPFLFQLKRKIKVYKYFCHIHTKKSKHINFGEEWRNYLFNNLLGNKEIISEILTDFENNSKLGLIFPEYFYKALIEYGDNILGSNFQYMEQIIKKISLNLKISSNNLDFPMGNMFWARVKSVHQLFEMNFNEQFPKENKQLDGTLMHGIERIWLYIVKYNGFYYKKIFKYL